MCSGANGVIMLALSPPLRYAELALPFGPASRPPAHCPLCFWPCAETDLLCRTCGAEFEIGLMQCARCATLVSSDEATCPSCGQDFA